MDLQNTQQHLRKLVIDGQLKEAITELDELTRKPPFHYLQDFVLQQSAIFGRVEREFHKGILDANDKIKAFNKVTDTLLHIITEMGNSAPDNFSPWSNSILQQINRQNLVGHGGVEWSGVAGRFSGLDVEDRQDRGSTVSQYAVGREPRVPSYFVGREELIRKVVDGLSQFRWYAVFGLGGTGKTTLASKVAKIMRSDKAFQVLWLDCRLGVVTDNLLEHLAQSVGGSVKLATSPAQRAAALRGMTAEKRLFIILDNVEEDHLLYEVLNAVGDGNGVLVTSRNRSFRSYGEFSVQKIPLEQNQLSDDEAVELLMNLSGVAPQDKDRREDWIALAESVGKMPLALIIVAQDMDLRSVKDPADYLTSRIKNGKWLRSEDTAQRIVAVLNDAYESLAESYQKPFLCLSVFKGISVSAEAILAVCNTSEHEDLDDFLPALKKRSLINQTETGTNSFHPLILEFAREKLNQTEDISEEMSQRFVQAYLNYYKSFLTINGGYEFNLERYPNLVPEEAELFHAIDTAFQLWISSNGSSKEHYRWLCTNMTFNISWYLEYRGYWDMRLQTCKRITYQLELDGVLRWNNEQDFEEFKKYRNLSGNLYVDQGWIYLRKKAYDRAERCADRALPLLNSADLQFGRELKAQVLLKSGKDPSTASQTFEELLKQRVIYTRQWFVYSFRLADALIQVEQLDKAEKYLREALEGIGQARKQKNESFTDVYARLTYRWAILQKDTAEESAFLRSSIQLFQQSGKTDLDSVLAKVRYAKILPDSARDLAVPILESALLESRTLGEIDLSSEISDLLHSKQKNS